MSKLSANKPKFEIITISDFPTKIITNEKDVEVYLDKISYLYDNK